MSEKQDLVEVNLNIANKMQNIQDITQNVITEKLKKLKSALKIEKTNIEKKLYGRCKGKERKRKND